MSGLSRCCGTGTPSTRVSEFSTPSLIDLQTHTKTPGFISSSWHITSNGMFAGSCIGVLLLVVALEALRRASREYDAHIARSHQRKITSSQPSTAAASRLEEANDPTKVSSTQSSTPLLQPQMTFTPNIFQQLVRAFLHMAQFAVAYIVMLLAMYYNGYMIICIFLGAFVGAFVFSWHSLALP
jgi:copper transporter 1